MEKVQTIALRERPDRELRKIILSCKKELMSLRFKRAKGDLKSTSSLKNVKRAVARAKTILSERSQKPLQEAR